MDETVGTQIVFPEQMNVKIVDKLSASVSYEEDLALKVALQLYTYADFEKIQNRVDFAIKCFERANDFVKAYKAFKKKGILITLPSTSTTPSIKPEGGTTNPDYGNEGGITPPTSGNEGGTDNPDSGNEGGAENPDSGNEGGITNPDDGNEGGESGGNEGGTTTPDSDNEGGITNPDSGNEGGESGDDEGGESGGNEGGTTNPDSDNEGGITNPDSGNEGGESEDNGGSTDSPEENIFTFTLADENNNSIPDVTVKYYICHSDEETEQITNYTDNTGNLVLPIQSYPDGIIHVIFEKENYVSKEIIIDENNTTYEFNITLELQTPTVLKRRINIYDNSTQDGLYYILNYSPTVDVVTYSESENTFTVDWGDNTPTEVYTTNGNEYCILSHTYPIKYGPSDESDFTNTITARNKYSLGYIENNGNINSESYIRNATTIGQLRNYETTEQIIIGNMCECLGYSVFKDCSSRNISIPKSVKRILDNAFENAFINNIDFSKTNIEYIGKNAFKYAIIHNIELPESIKYIGEYSFNGCKQIEKVQINGTNETIIDKYAFYKSIHNKPTYINCKEICENAFRDCKFNDLQFGDDVEIIGENAFNSYITNIGTKALYLPKNLKILEDLAFNCIFLPENIYIYNNVTNIGENAFNTILTATSYNLYFENYTQTSEIPEIFENSMSGKLNNIYVPNNLLSEWKTTGNWTNYKDKILSK